MNIAELFVNLGVKGSDKTVGALTGMKTGLKDTASMSLEAKAALVGVFYALQRIFSASGQMGTDLTNFNSLLGVSAQTLQEYRYAARQVGVSNQEVDNTFKTLQATMTKTLMGEQAPKGLARVSQLTGGMTPEDIKKFAEQPQLLIQKLQEYAQKETNTGLRNEVLKSFGVGDSMIAAMQRNAFRPEVLAKAPKYSDSEVASLDKANIAWSNLGTKIEMAFGRFNAKHGGQLVNDISKITDHVIRLVEALTVLADKAKVFEIIGMSFQGWTQILGFLTQQIDDTTKKGAGNKLQEIGAGTLDFLKDMPSVFGAMAEEIMQNAPPAGQQQPVKTAPQNSVKPGQPNAPAKPPRQSSVGDQNRPLLKLVTPESPAMPDVKTVAAPRMPAATQVASAGSTNNISVQQSLNFQHEGKDPQKTADSVKKSVSEAYRQMSAQSQGS